MSPAVHFPAFTPAPRWFTKLNPNWWWQDETMPVGMDRCWWARRNWLQNLFAFVIGVQDHDHTFSGSATSDGIFAPAPGRWNFGVVRLVGCWSWIPLPLISYRDNHRELYAGWRPYGAFGMCWRKANAKSWKESTR
jgi:hypothetical protein